MKKLTTPLVMATLLLGSQAVLAAEPIVIKFSHVVAVDTPIMQAARTSSDRRITICWK